MAVSLLKKFLYGILVAWGVITVVFLLFLVLPGDPARMMAGQRADESTLRNIRKELGLDRPRYIQYLAYLNDLSPLSLNDPVNGESILYLDRQKYSGARILLRFSADRALVIKSPYLGRSFQSRERVGSILIQALPNTFILAFSSMVLAFFLGTAAGILAALGKDRFYDRVILQVAGATETLNGGGGNFEALVRAVVHDQFPLQHVAEYGHGMQVCRQSGFRR